MSFEEKELPDYPELSKKILNFNALQADYLKLDTVSKQFYYWVNYSRVYPKEFFDSVVIPYSKVYAQLKGTNLKSLQKDLTNAASLPLLSLNADLINIAQNHSNDITRHNAPPSHNSTNGLTFTERFKKVNLKNCGGENISYGANKPVFLLVLLYLDINVAELGHRKALLNPNFIYTGLGNSFYKNGNLFLVEDFACKQN